MSDCSICITCHRNSNQQKENGCDNIRNVFFEPVNDPTKDWTDAALARIQAAFLMKRPAVISTHRVNFVGFIDPKNRENGLVQLEKLLQTVVKKWPDVKFITTNELSNYINTNE